MRRVLFRVALVLAGISAWTLDASAFGRRSRCRTVCAPAPCPVVYQPCCPIAPSPPDDPDSDSSDPSLPPAPARLPQLPTISETIDPDERVGVQHFEESLQTEPASKAP